MDETDRQLRDLLEAAVGEPPRKISIETVRRRVARRRAVEYVSGAAAVALIAVVVPAGLGALGHTRGPAARHRPPVPTVYVLGRDGNKGAVIPIGPATNKPGKPIVVDALPRQMAVMPDGKTAYVTTGSPNAVVPVNTVTNKPGKPIKLGSSPAYMALTPDGKTLYVATMGAGGCLPLPGSGSCHRRHGPAPEVIPISTATNTPGKPIHVAAGQIVITPDSKTAYALPGGIGTSNAVIPISTATNTPGKPISLGAGITQPGGNWITPDGKTLYVGATLHNAGQVLIPISTTTNTPGKAIHLQAGPIAFTPDSKTAYVVALGNPCNIRSTVTPVSTATNTPGRTIRLHNGCYFPEDIAVTPDGTTAYLINFDFPAKTDRVSAEPIVPISAATNTAGKPILVPPTGFLAPYGSMIAFTPHGTTAYVASRGSVIPISTTTDKPGKPIPVRPWQPGDIAITP